MKKNKLKIMNNLREFKKLIETYESVTLRKIILKYKKARINDDSNCYYTDHQLLQETARLLTGFGTTGSCTLCNVVPYIVDRIQPDCEKCIWMLNSSSKLNYCYKGLNNLTYSAISNAITPEQLLQAFKNRALYMKEFLKLNNISLT
jgi:hypothetical protein